MTTTPGDYLVLVVHDFRSTNKECACVRIVLSMLNCLSILALHETIDHG